MAFFAIAVMAFANQSQAQTSTITVTNNTGCLMRVIIEGYVGPVPCSGLKAGDWGWVASGATVVLNWERNGLPVSATFSDGTAHEPSTGMPGAALLDVCTSVNITGTSPCGTYNFFYVNTGTAQNIVIQ